jgi:hypothetical protein
MDTQRLLLVTGVLCVEGTMSTCACPDDPSSQEMCGKFEKATRCSRCMYLTFDKYCTSPKAQAISNGHRKPRRKIKHRDREADFEQRQAERRKTNIRKLRRCEGRD